MCRRSNPSRAELKISIKILFQAIKIKRHLLFPRKSTNISSNHMKIKSLTSNIKPRTSQKLLNSLKFIEIVTDLVFSKGQTPNLKEKNYKLHKGANH